MLEEWTLENGLVKTYAKWAGTDKYGRGNSKGLVKLVNKLPDGRLVITSFAFGQAIGQTVLDQTGKVLSKTGKEIGKVGENIGDELGRAGRNIKDELGRLGKRIGL
jgi:hypothetical protein